MPKLCVNYLQVVTKSMQGNFKQIEKVSTEQDQTTFPNVVYIVTLFLSGSGRGAVTMTVAIISPCCCSLLFVAMKPKRLLHECTREVTLLWFVG